MKEKIAIITLNGNHNFGNRLQNYALERNIEKLGYSVETIINKYRVDTVNQTEATGKKGNGFFKKRFSDKKQMVINKIHNKEIQQLYKKRYEKFKAFSDTYINEIEEVITEPVVSEELVNSYKYFVAGSDQVWNPNNLAVSEVNFLTFAPKEKSISYAASFAVNEISDDKKEEYKKWLEGIKHISVREDSGVNIVKELVDTDVELVLDPTLLLTKEEWLKVSKPSENKPKKKYLLTYFLGEKSNETKKYIKKVAKENKLVIVDINDVADRKHYAEGPSEFIDYINDATVFLTNSFHGIVFSLLMETPFIVFDRDDTDKVGEMGSRVDTFLNKFKLQARKYNGENSNLFYVDYTKAKLILGTEIKKSKKYLTESLD